MRAAWRSRRPSSESWLPIALVVVSQPDVWAPKSLNLGHLVGPAPAVALLYTLTALSLIWRQRLPLVVLAFIVTLDALEYLAFGAPEGLGSLLPTVFAVYAVGRYARLNALVVAAPLALLGVAVHELTDPIFQLSGSNAVFYAVVAAAWPLGWAFQTRARHAQQLRQQADDLVANQAKLADEVANGERERIARELHDIVGHGLSVVVLQLVGAAGLLDRGDTAAARERLTAGEDSARQALSEMRRLLGLLRDDGADATVDPQPGLKDLDRLVTETVQAGAEISVEVHGEARQLPASLDLSAYRILQESLTNVLKHAAPPKAAVRLQYASSEIVLDVEDEGRPCQVVGIGRGLTGMRERIAVFGGDLAAGPRPGGGFRVRARIPIPE